MCWTWRLAVQGWVLLSLVDGTDGRCRLKVPTLAQLKSGIVGRVRGVRNVGAATNRVRYFPRQLVLGEEERRALLTRITFERIGEEERRATSAHVQLEIAARMARDLAEQGDPFARLVVAGEAHQLVQDLLDPGR